MTFTTNCPNCGLALTATSDQVGRQGKCSGCGTIFTIETPRAAAMPAPTTWSEPPPSDGPIGTVRVGEGISRGFNLLHSNIGPFLLIGLCFLLINFGIGLAGMIPCLGPILSLASTFIVQPALVCGFYRAVLKQHDGGQADVADLFSAFDLWLDYILLVLVQILISIAVCLPAGAIIFASLMPMLFQGQQEPNVPVLIAGIVVLIFSAILVGLAFVYSYTALIDRRRGFWDAISTSWQLMIGNPFGTFGMVLFTAFCSMLGFCVFCVGLVYAVPLIHCVIAAVYRTAIYRTATYAQPVAVSPGWGAPPSPSTPPYSPPPPPAPPPPPTGV